MAKAAPIPNLRALLDDVPTNPGPIGKFEMWLSEQPEAIATQVRDLLGDDPKKLGHSRIAKLLTKHCGAPEFTGEQIARARKKLA